MNRIILLLFAILPLLATAQQSSKSKSKDRFREKDDPANVVRVQNARFLNSAGADYSPVYYKNGLVFVSARLKNGPQDKKTGQTYSEIYFAPFDPGGEPIAPSTFSVEINSSLHEGPVSFSRDFKYMFFTRNNMYKGVQKADNTGKVRLKIYMARKGAIDWGDVRELPFNSETYSCLHPSLSADGNRLYFASDMPGGYGGFDLYYSDYTPQAGWQTPINLGPEINSSKNELFPYIHISGNLFFCSDGHNSLGGLDVFYVDDVADGSKEVVNLGEPFNSKTDDLGFIMNDEGTAGFFSSEREEGYGKDDIFSFTIEKGIEGVEKPVSKQIQIVVTDAKSGSPLQGAAIRVLKPSEDGFVSSDQQSYYNIDLAPVTDGSNVLSLQLVRKDIEDLGPADLYTNVSGQAQTDLYKYRSYLLLVSLDGFQTVERLFTFEGDEVPVIKVPLSVAPKCHRVSGIVATDQFGRRIVNASLSFTNKGSGAKSKVRTNLNGEYEICLPSDGEYLVQVEKEGFLPENANVMVFSDQGSYKEIRLRPTQLEGASASNPNANALRIGSIVVMDKINFEHNKATLNQMAVRQLDALYDLMKRYPDMQIDLVAHTDTRGDAQQNLSLSELRAKNAKAYLVFRGIGESRINAVGKGGSEPRNRCAPGVECTEEEHLFNVRYEAIVTRIGA